jgi:hypothetical protein
VNPVRIDNVTDFNFAYWHSATFNNDGTKIVFTDEWGGGTGARCREGDRMNWGANAIFDIVDTPEGKKMQFASYYKLPVTQTTRENCVAHNGSLVPVPGRDIMAQAWYQGGLSVFDFTDSANPKEIAYFDRGPVSPTALLTGGLWSTYYYEGTILGTEIARGFDLFGLTPGAELSANEIAAAAEVDFGGQFNAQLQPRLAWAPSFAVVRSHLDQLVRAGAIDAKTLGKVTKHIEKAEEDSNGKKAKGQLTAAAAQLTEGAQYDALRQALQALADAQ